MKDGRKFGEYMNDQHTVNRWVIVKVFVAGAFCGGLLTIAFGLFGLI
jgi:uncharacterized membrane protein YoaK (UPF0700 family)